MIPEVQALAEASQPSLIYVAGGGDSENPELLLYTEESVQSSRWKIASEKSRQFWYSIKDRFDQYSLEAFAGDRLVWKLRKLKRIKVILTQPIDPVVVRARMNQMLRDQSYHHMRWMIIDTLLLPLTALTMLLPGPNVLFFYLLFRIYSHWHSYRCASNTSFEITDVQVTDQGREVNALIRKSKDIRTGLGELRKRYGLRAMQEHKFIPQSQVLKNAWKKLIKKSERVESEKVK